MNKYQLNILWTAATILLLFTYPLLLFVFGMKEVTSIILSGVSIVLVFSTLLFISLRNQDTESIKINMRIIKKYIFILSSVILVTISIYAIRYIIKVIDESNFEKKETLLTNHIKNPFWLINNLKISNVTLWYNPDYSHKGYLRITEFDFSLWNKSPIDVFSFPIVLEIYNNKNEPLRFQKKFIVLCSIQAYSTKNVKHIFGFNEIDMVPEGFQWLYHTEGNVIPSGYYIKNHTYKEINDYVVSDSASLESDIHIDMESLKKFLEDSTKSTKGEKQK